MTASGERAASRRWLPLLLVAALSVASPSASRADELDSLAVSEVARLNALYGTKAALRVADGAETDSTPDDGVTIGRRQVRDLLAAAAVARPAEVERFIVGHEMAHQLQFRLYGRDVLSRSAEERRTFECQADLLSAANLLPRQRLDPDQAAGLADVLQIAFDTGTESYIGSDHPDHEQRRLAVRFGLGYAALTISRSLPAAERDVALEAEIIRKLDIRPGERLEEWSLKISRRLVHYERTGVSALALGDADIQWDRRAEHPFVSFGLPYTNTSLSTLHVEMEVATLSVPRFNKSDTSKWDRIDVAEYSFDLRPGERHLVSGQLRWYADDDHMPTLEFPPGPQTMVSAVSDARASAGRTGTALPLMARPSEPQSLSAVIMAYVNSPEDCYLRYRANSAARRIDLGNGDYSDSYTASLPVPGASDAEISKDSDGSCELEAVVHTGRSRDGATEAARQFAATASAALDKFPEETMSSAGIPRFKVPVLQGPYYVSVSTSLRTATGMYTVRVYLRKED